MLLNFFDQSGSYNNYSMNLICFALISAANNYSRVTCKTGDRKILI